MHPSTAATISELKGVDWFRNAGLSDVKLARVALSWDEAMEHCASLDWRNLRLDAANQLARRVREQSNERYQQWNEVVAEMKHHMIPLVAQKCRGVAEVHRLPKRFIDAVNWDILNLCMEAEYADIVPPAFFAGQAYWYLAGHFPCGWDGDYPHGRIIVY